MAGFSIVAIASATLFMTTLGDLALKVTPWAFHVLMAEAFGTSTTEASVVGVASPAWKFFENRGAFFTVSACATEASQAHVSVSFGATSESGLRAINMCSSSAGCSIVGVSLWTIRDTTRNVWKLDAKSLLHGFLNFVGDFGYRA